MYHTDTTVPPNLDFAQPSPLAGVWGDHDLNCEMLVCGAFGIHDQERRMNLGKALFARVMEFVPWKTFGPIIERHSGERRGTCCNPKPAS